MQKTSIWFAIVILIVLFIMATSGFSIAQDQKSGSAVFELGEVIVTAQQEKMNLATTVSEVTEADIKAKGAQTVADALDLLPGISLETGGKNAIYVKVRGFEQDDVKVLIDGIPAHEPYTGLLDLSFIPVDAIAKITVTKGASSVLYGANSMGGVINIITKKGGKEPFTGLTTSFGDYQTRNYILNHGAAVGNFNYWLTYGYRESDGFRLSSDFDKDSPWVGINSEFHEDGGKRDLSYYRKRTFDAKIGYEPDEKTKLYLTFDYHNNDRGVPTAYDRYWEFSKWEQWHLNLVGEKQFTNVFTAKVRAFYVDHEDTLEDVSWDEQHKTQKKWFETSSWDGHSYGAEFHTLFDFGKYSLLTVGFNYLKDKTKQQEYLDKDCFGVIRGMDQPGWGPEEEYEADTYTIGIEDEISLTERVSFIAGVSYDYFKPKQASNAPVPDSIDTFNPQAGIVFDITDATSLHASVGKKTRFPKLQELFSEHAGGNPDLDPQKTITYEAGVKHSFTTTIEGSLVYFYNDIKDMIDRITQDGDKIFVNIGEATTQGIEAELAVKFTPDFLITTNYTYLASEDKKTGQELQGRPRHRLNLDVRYRFPFGLATAFQASYTRRQFAEYEEGQPRREYPDYLLLNARVSQDLGSYWGVNSEIFAELKNITDKDYDIGGGPEPGRNFLIGLTLTY